MKTITIKIPPCGHPYCFGFMSCIEEANIRMLQRVLHPCPVFEPGSELTIEVIMDTGFRHKDWILPESKKDLKKFQISGIATYLEGFTYSVWAETEESAIEQVKKLASTAPKDALILDDVTIDIQTIGLKS